MLSNISWQSYGIFLALAVVFYYAVVVILFFHHPLRRGLLSRGLGREQPLQKHTPVDLSMSNSSAASVPEDTPEYIPAAHSLVGEVHAFFASMSAANQSKAALLSDLKIIIGKYPGVKETPYQHSLNHLILLLAQQNGFLNLSAEEVSGVWT